MALTTVLLQANDNTGISDFKKGETNKLVLHIPKILNKENDHFTESISDSLRRSGVISQQLIQHDHTI